MKYALIMAFALSASWSQAKIITPAVPNARQVQVFRAVGWIKGTDQVLWSTKIPFFTSETMAAGRMNYAYSVLGFKPLYTNAVGAEALALRIAEYCKGVYTTACLADAIAP